MGKRVLGIVAIVVLSLAATAGAQEQKTSDGACDRHPRFQEAVRAMRQLHDAIPQYRKSHGKFPDRLEQLTAQSDSGKKSADQANLLDEMHLRAEQYDYRIRFDASGGSWKLWLAPTDAGRGCGSFYLDETGNIHVRWKPGDASATDETVPMRIQVAPPEQQKKMKKSVPPVYPEDAKFRGIQGKVHIQVVIDMDGFVTSVDVLSGKGALKKAAAEAVRQWQYETTLVNGVPVEVVTTLDVIFILARR